MSSFLAFMLLLFILLGCGKERDIKESLTAQQNTLLSIPATGDTITFNENGQLIKTVVDNVSRQYRLIQRFKAAGSFTEGPTYFSTEDGGVYYLVAHSYDPKIYIDMEANDPYHQTGGYQTVTVYNTSASHTYKIDFDQTIPTKLIGGTLYSHVAVATVGQDSLFYKENIGILGWKAADSSYTVFRVL